MSFSSALMLRDSTRRFTFTHHKARKMLCVPLNGCSHLLCKEVKAFLLHVFKQVVDYCSTIR